MAEEMSHPCVFKKDIETIMQVSFTAKLTDIRYRGG
jgi:hypothetical protein